MPYVVVFFVDASTDKFFIGVTNGSTTADRTLAMQWVNRGWQGSGAKAAGLAFPQVPVSGGPDGRLSQPASLRRGIGRAAHCHDRH